MEKAAKKGDAEAMRGPGTLCQSGTGVAADPVEADPWYLMAVAYGDDLALAESNVLQKGMTLEQIQQAQKRAANPLKP
jgi:TPR repeat protein